MPDVDRNLYFNNLSGEYEEGYRDPVTHVIHFKSGKPPDATDAALLRASELSVSLGDVEGSGKEGRVTVKDVENHAASLSAPQDVEAEEAASSEAASPEIPSVHDRADQLGVDLSQVKASGKSVTVQDVEDHFRANQQAQE